MPGSAGHWSYCLHDQCKLHNDVGPSDGMTPSQIWDSLRGVQVYGNSFAGALGYVIVCIRFDYIKGYDEDQVCLVMEDNSVFASRAPLILRMPTTERVLNVMTEDEITKLSAPWANVRTSTIQQAFCTRVNQIRTNITTKPLDIRSFDEAVRWKDKSASNHLRLS